MFVYSGFYTGWVVIIKLVPRVFTSRSTTPLLQWLESQLTWRHLRNTFYQQIFNNYWTRLSKISWTQNIIFWKLCKTNKPYILHVYKFEGNAHEQSVICSWTTFSANAHAQTIICRKISQSKWRKQWMIISFVCFSDFVLLWRYMHWAQNTTPQARTVHHTCFIFFQLRMISEKQHDRLFMPGTFFKNYGFYLFRFYPFSTVWKNTFQGITGTLTNELVQIDFIHAYK